MRSLDPSNKAGDFEIKRQEELLEQIDSMTEEMGRLAAELDSQIIKQERQSGISDPTHFAYPPLAKSARQRQQKLQLSMKELNEQKKIISAEVAEAQIAMKKAEVKKERKLQSNSPLFD